MQVAFLASFVFWHRVGPALRLVLFRAVAFEHFGYFTAIVFRMSNIFSRKNFILCAGNPGLLFDALPPLTEWAFPAQGL